MEIRGVSIRSESIPFISDCSPKTQTRKRTRNYSSSCPGSMSCQVSVNYTEQTEQHRAPLVRRRSSPRLTHLRNTSRPPSRYRYIGMSFLDCLEKQNICPATIPLFMSGAHCNYAWLPLLEGVSSDCSLFRKKSVGDSIHGITKTANSAGRALQRERPQPFCSNFGASRSHS